MEAIAAQSLSYHPWSTTNTSLSPKCLQQRLPKCALPSRGVGKSKCNRFNLAESGLALSPECPRLNNLECIKVKHCSQRNVVGVVHVSQQGGSTVDVAQGWLLEPVGDGDWRHIGYKVALPGAYEIFSSKLTVGRAPDKADIVIPVATVSGLHARIQNKEGSLFITDLDSTNGTFINEKRVPPGATALVPPGSLITFGDTNLALFRVSRLEKALKIEEETEDKAENESIEVAPQPETTS